MICKMQPLGSTGSTIIVHSEGRQDIHQLPVSEIRDMFKSAGALLFRGFSVDAQVMKSFAGLFSTRFNRDRLRPPVEGTDGYVQLVTEGMTYVEPHSEQGNSPFRPDAIWFTCSTPAAQGGETLLWDGVRLWEGLSDELRILFSSKRIRFFQRYTSDKWKLFLGQESTVEDAKRKLDDIEDVSYYVDSDRAIYLEYVCSAVVRTRYGQQKAFANSLLSERKNTLGELMSFEDGTPIPEDAITEVEQAMQSLTEPISWQKGDLAFIDNSRFLHGRNAFGDPSRRLYSCLSFLNF